MFSSEQRRNFIINKEEEILYDLNTLSYNDFFDKYLDVFTKYQLPIYENNSHIKTIINSIILTKLDLTDAKLAKKAGIHQGSIYAYRRGKTISNAYREKLNKVLNINLLF